MIPDPCFLHLSLILILPSFSIHLNVPPLSVGSPRKLGTQCCCTFQSKLRTDLISPKSGEKQIVPPEHPTQPRIFAQSYLWDHWKLNVHLSGVPFLLHHLLCWGFSVLPTLLRSNGQDLAPQRNAQGSSYRREDGGEGSPAVALVPIGLHPCSAPSLLLPSSSS